MHIRQSFVAGFEGLVYLHVGAARHRALPSPPRGAAEVIGERTYADTKREQVTDKKRERSHSPSFFCFW